MQLPGLLADGSLKTEVLGTARTLQEGLRYLSVSWPETVAFFRSQNYGCQPLKIGGSE